jgi:hypothetical protein
MPLTLRKPAAMLPWLVFTTLLALSGCGGGGSDNTDTGTGGVTTDTTPNSFSFAAQVNAPLDQWVESAAITVSGINAAASISVSNGEYAINGGAYSSSNGTVNNGNTVRLRHRSASNNGSTTTSTLTIGGVSASFSSTTLAATGGTLDALVTIQFPLGQAKTERSTITVSGNAISTSPLLNVSINGVDATLSSSSALALGQVGIATSPPEYQLNWSAEVPLPANADTTLAVAVTDTAGNSNAQAASVSVSRKFAPSTFSFDALSNRLYALVENNELVSIDLASNEYQFLSTLQGADRPVIAADTGKVFYATALENTVTLYSTDITTGVTNQVHSFTVPLAEQQFINLTDIIYVEASQTLFFMLAYPANERADFLHELYSFVLDSNTLTLVSSDEKGSGPRLETNKLAWVGDKLLGFTWERDGLISIDVSSGNRSQVVSGIPGFNMALVKGETDTIVYVAGFDGVFRVDLTTANIDTISAEAAQDIYVTAQIESLAFDAQQNRLLLSDSMAGLVLAVDLATGTRSKVLSSGIGDGRYLLMPQFLAVDPDTDKAYVLDANNNASQALLAVDLTSANRSFVTDSANLPADIASDLLLDKARNRLIAIYANQIIAVDLTTSAVSVLKQRGGDSGINVDSFNGGVIDAVNNKILISSFATDNTLVELDLITNQHQLVSITPEDANNAVSGIIDITLNSSADKVYLLSQSQGLVYQMDRATATAQVIVSSCLNAAQQNMLDLNYTTPQHIIYDARSDNLLVSANAVLEVDLSDNSCMAYGNNGDAHIDLAITGNNQLLTTQQNKLLQHDRHNNQSVVISR